MSKRALRPRLRVAQPAARPHGKGIRPIGDALALRFSTILQLWPGLSLNRKWKGITMFESVEGIADFYAHALAIECQAIIRYKELADQLEGGNRPVAELFRWLSDKEAEHAQNVARRAAGIALPELKPSEYEWRDAHSPEADASFAIHPLMTPRDALEIALRNEQRARDYFRHSAHRAAAHDMRRLAGEMANEEEEHIAQIESALRELAPGSRDRDILAPRGPANDFKRRLS